jgi:hypothetical protein
MQGDFSAGAPEEGALFALLAHTLNGALLGQMVSTVISDIQQNCSRQLSSRGQLASHWAQFSRGHTLGGDGVVLVLAMLLHCEHYHLPGKLQEGDVASFLLLLPSALLLLLPLLPLIVNDNLGVFVHLHLLLPLLVIRLLLLLGKQVPVPHVGPVQLQGLHHAQVKKPGVDSPVPCF